MSLSVALKAPFPYFGGKSAIAPIIWSALGNVPVYVEPFAGSLAVLLSRPHDPRIETVNDMDGMIANVWRAVKYDPTAVASYADDIVSEVDLHSRHAWLVKQRAGLADRLMADPDYYDAKVAGWWIWGASCWIGSGWCSGKGPWQVIDGKLTKPGTARASRAGVERKRPHLMHAGKTIHGVGQFPGVSRKLPYMRGSQGIQGQGIVPEMGHLAEYGTLGYVPHLGDDGRGVHRQVPDLGGDGSAAGRGVHASGISRQAPRLSADAQGCNVQTTSIYDWMQRLAERLRRVRICCGDWSRIMGPAGTVHVGTTGVLLDPPYRHDGRDDDVYHHDGSDTFAAAKSWAIAHGDDQQYRIVLCGYEGEAMPASWRLHTWQARGGYGNQGTGRGKENRSRECLWISRHCVERQRSLFEIGGVV